ncbi:MAG TPA: DUF4402 domain-containing protein [Holophagaceae bacterium]|jgi:hypothetical protein|nr:DUF4402 domain-containing protein [Holophagaceae bacterium]
MKLFRQALASALMLCSSWASAQTPTVTIQSNMDVGQYLIQANGASVTQDSITGVVTLTNAVSTGVYPVIFCSLLCKGTVGHTFHFQYSGTQPTTFTLTGQTTGQIITVNTSNIQSSAKESGVNPTFATGGTIAHEGGIISPLTTTLPSDTYVGSFPSLQIVDDTSGATSAAFVFTITIRIQTAIAIAKVQDLAFGEVIALGSAGTVAVTPTGTTYAGGAGQGPVSGTIASFTATGGKGSNYQITLGGGTPGQGTVTLTSGANTMTASLQSYVNSVATAQGTLSAAAGTQTFLVGGTLNVGAAQAEGTYTGTFTATVTYN